MENDASDMSYVELISCGEEEAGNLKSPDKHVVDKCKSTVNKTMDKGKNPVRKIVDKGESLLKKTMNKGKSKVLVDDIPVKKHVRRNNAIVIEENVNPVPMDTDSDTESESEAVDEFNYTVYRYETLMEHEEFLDDLIRKLRDGGDGVTDPFKIVESIVKKYPIHDVETHWRMQKPKAGEKFIDVDQLKECPTYYALANGYSLWSYGKAILESNHGSTVKVGVTVNPYPKTYFDRFYVCFKGETLTAIGRDGNNHIFPVAWAIVNVENKDNWSWFLDLLGDDLDMPTGNGLTLISDQHKSIVKDVMPHVEHRQYAWHIYEGFRKQFSGVEFRSLVWAASKASYPGLFNKIMDKIKRVNPKAYQYLLDKDPKTWSRAYFRIGINCEAVVNGFSECFNSVLLRSEDIYPNIQKRLEVTKDQHRFWHVIPTGGNLFDVKNGSQAFRVHEEHRTCTCRLWHLSGLPCAHAIAVIFKLNRRVKDY
ncbi:pentatricopeptide repeat-containing protein [Tanacetum coccineum]